MKVLKVALLILLVLFVGIQFIRPEENSGTTDPSSDISAAVAVPDAVGGILRESCYDCHSNSTRYPWYAGIQPVRWWLEDHIGEAKGQLNFSEFATGSLRRQYHKLEEISEQVGAGEMPLPSYLILHRDAELSADQKTLLLRWVEDSRSSMKARYPVDSLERRGN
ncbi:MAG TPA: heme-binding domain-containing protein [Bacteroidota bacterium]|nr:heme-binding domain-containing protein [Bacteroidota bacterium]